MTSDHVTPRVCVCMCVCVCGAREGVWRCGGVCVCVCACVFVTEGASDRLTLKLFTPSGVLLSCCLLACSSGFLPPPYLSPQLPARIAHTHSHTHTHTHTQLQSLGKRRTIGGGGGVGGAWPVHSLNLQLLLLHWLTHCRQFWCVSHTHMHTHTQVQTHSHTHTHTHTHTALL